MTARPVRACWCGGKLGREIGQHYRCCDECGTGVLAVQPAPGHFDVSDDERDFYGRRYWTDYSRAHGRPDIRERARADLSERCVFWLERLIEVAQPPGRALEIGCGHGAFVRLLKELGFDAAGTELSGWVVEFARRTFDVPILRGRLETLDLEPGFKCITAFDVLEHLSDPLETVRRCRDLLAPDGVLLLQTPWYRGEGADWGMFQEEEHIYLFTEASIRLLLARAGFQEMLVRPSLFPYDMWVVAARGRLPVAAAGAVAAPAGSSLPAAFRTVLDLSHELRDLRERLAEVTRRLGEAEVDRSVRLRDINTLTTLLREAEADRAARLEVIQRLEARISDLGRTWAWRLWLYSTLPASLIGRKKVE